MAEYTREAVRVGRESSRSMLGSWIGFSVYAGRQRVPEQPSTHRTEPYSKTLNTTR